MFGLRAIRCLGVAILCGVLGGGNVGAQETVGSRADFVLRDGVVIDIGSGSLVVMRPGGGIDALDASTGKLRWTSAEADRPLLAEGSRLLAQVATGDAELAVAVLDIAENGRTLAKGTLHLPGGAVASIDDGPEHHFEVRATMTPDGALLAWQDKRAPTAAMPALQGQLQILQGAARVNLGTGKIVETDREAGRAMMTPPTPNLPAGQGPVAMPERGVMFRGAGDIAAMASARVADKRVWNNYLWSFYDLRTGKALGEVRSHQNYAPFAVLGPVLLHEVQPYERHQDGVDEEVPLSVAAVDLKTGAQLWRHPVRDTRYRGPLPE